jgi:biopolymer transport protein ExbD
MRAWAVVLVCVLGCERGDRSPDCDVVRKEPGSAAARLSQKYPGAPVKVAEIIERCVAPSGAPCERLAKIVAVTAPAGVAELCADMPPEMQRCMLPSYALANPDECAKIRDQIAAAAAGPIEIEPRTGPPPPGEPPCAELRIELGAGEVVVRREEVERLPRAGGQIDHAALRARLGELASRCKGDAAIASADDRPYQEVIELMDTAIAAGFVDIGLDVPGAPAALPRAAAGPASGGGALASAPVIAVTRDAISIGGQEVARLPADVTEAVAAGLAKARAASAEARDLAILQADAATPMRTIKQIIAAGRRAGFDNVVFAVNRR